VWNTDRRRVIRDNPLYLVDKSGRVKRVREPLSTGFLAFWFGVIVGAAAVLAIVMAAMSGAR
jgi:hypothetical protein